MSWVAAWATAPMGGAPVVGPFDEGFPGGHTIRQVVPLAAGGSAVRVRLTNAYGVQPLHIASVRIEGVAVRFDGDRGVTVPASSDVVSDELELTMPPLADVVVELDVAEATGHPTRGLSGVTSGDAGAYAWFLSGIDVLTDGDRGCAVAIGDSLTAGGRDSWPGVTAARGEPIVNVGIGGNRLLTTSPCFGMGGLARLERDVFSQTAVRTVVAMWTNDLGMYGATPESIKAISASVGYDVPFHCFDPTSAGTDEDMIAGYTELIAEAHMQGLRVILGTTPPFKGSFAWRVDRGAARRAVNEWVLTSGAADGTIDFAAALADPDDRERLRPDYDRGDHLHPSPAGSRAMADAFFSDVGPF